MFFIHNLNFIARGYQFEHRYFIFGHELGRYRSTNQGRILFAAAGNILLSLNDPMLVGTAFSLDGNNELTAKFINSDIDFIDFYLSKIFDSCSEVILKRIGG